MVGQCRGEEGAAVPMWSTAAAAVANHGGDGASGGLKVGGVAANGKGMIMIYGATT